MRGLESVQKPSIHRRGEMGELLGGIAVHQGQGDRFGQMETVKAPMRRFINMDEAPRKRRHLRPSVLETGLNRRHLMPAQGKGFGRDDMKPHARRGMRLPQRPGGQDVEPGPEAGLADGEAAPGSHARIVPGAGQAGPGKEDMAGFGQTVRPGEITVLEPGREGHALRGPAEFGSRCGTRGLGHERPDFGALRQRA